MATHAAAGAAATPTSLDAAAAERIIARVGLPLAPLPDAARVEFATGLPERIAAQRQAHYLLAGLWSEAICDGLAGPLRPMTAGSLKAARDAIRMMRKQLARLEREPQSPVTMSARAALARAIDEYASAIEAEAAFRDSLEQETKLRDLLASFADASLNANHAEARRLKDQLRRHPARDSDARIQFALDNDRGAGYLRSLLADRGTLHRDGAPIEIFIRGKLAAAFSTLFGAPASSRFDVYREEWGGPFLGFASAFLAELGVERSKQTIRSDLYRDRKPSGRAARVARSRDTRHQVAGSDTCKGTEALALQIARAALAPLVHAHKDEDVRASLAPSGPESPQTLEPEPRAKPNRKRDVRRSRPSPPTART